MADVLDSKKKSWCPLPWKSVNIRNNGDFRVCCHANSSANKGILRDIDGEPLNAANASLEAVRNSELLKEIRLSMLRGERHPTCQRCNLEDDSGIRSRRTFETEFWKESFGPDSASAQTKVDGSIDTKQIPVGYFDIRFGNLCNLKCRMCGPTDSSQWYKEHFETVGPRFQETSGKVTLERAENTVRVSGKNPYSWHMDDSFWRQIENEFDHVKIIYTVGGEPLLIDRHYDLLNKLVSSGKSKQIIMDYNSNITVIPPRVLELWKNFKEIRIGASIDAYGKINEYIRHPSKWAVLEKNLKLLDDAEGNFNVWITTTVQAYNIYFLTDFLKWKILQNFKRVNNVSKTPFLTTHPLHSPKHFNIKILPHSVKLMVAEKFSDFFENWFVPYVHSSEFSLDKKNNWLQKMDQLLNGYRDMMFSEDWSHLLPEFLEITHRMDSYRGESFQDVMPEIAIPIFEELKKINAKTKAPVEFSRDLGV